MSDDELRMNRRLFLKHSAAATAMSAAWYSVAMKTDALARAQQYRMRTFGTEFGSGMPYPYFEPPPG